MAIASRRSASVSTGADVPKARSSMSSTRANRELVGRVHEERGVWFVEAENRRINQDLLIPPGERGECAAGTGRRGRNHRAARARTAKPIARVKEVLGSATDPGIEIEIALRKHALPFEWSAAATRQAQRLPRRRAPGRSQGPHGPDALAAGHDRRRNREGFRRCRLLRARWPGVPPDRRDRRRLPLRARWRRARCRRARARHVRLFPAARDSDAARGAVERAVLAEGRRRPAVHGMRHADRRRGAIQSLRVLPGRHAFARAPDVHAGLHVADRSRRGSARTPRESLLPHSRSSVRALQGAARRARAARRHRLRHGRACARVRRATARSCASFRRRATTRTS